MSDNLLPTPTASDSETHPNDMVRHASLASELNCRRPTSPSSPGSEDSTSPPRPTASPASDRSSGTPPAPESSSDGGRLFPDGETSPGSALLPTPTANDLSSGMTPERWDEWADEMRERHRNGNGHGRNLGVEMRRRTSSSEVSPASPPPPPDAARAPLTTVGSGLSSPVSLGSWDPDMSSWRTSQVSLLSTEDERFPRSWETWPRSGMTRRGRAFALPTSARCHRRERVFLLARYTGGSSADTLTEDAEQRGDAAGESNSDTAHADGIGHESLLRPPSIAGVHAGEASAEPSDAGGRAPADPGIGAGRLSAGWDIGREHAASNGGEEPPDADDERGDARRQPASAQTEGGGSPAEPRRRDRAWSWGPYGAAIERWERVLMRPAPHAVDDKGRLAPAFVEWMMGFPEGWTADLTRTQALKALGNAVVPAQGAAALSHLVDLVQMEAIA